MTSRNHRSDGKNFAKQLEFLQFWLTLKSNKNTFPSHNLTRIVQMTQKSAKFYDSAKKITSNIWCHVHFKEELLQILYMGFSVV